MTDTEINCVNTFLSDFTDTWNITKKGKEIQFISKIEKKEENSYVVVADFGLKNSIRVITDLLQALT